MGLSLKEKQKNRSILLSAWKEAYEKGLVTKKDTGGLKMEWGNGDAVLEMIKKIANRQDIGKLLGEGLIEVLVIFRPLPMTSKMGLLCLI